MFSSPDCGLDAHTVASLKNLEQETSDSSNKSNTAPKWDEQNELDGDEDYIYSAIQGNNYDSTDTYYTYNEVVYM